ncbi:MAG: LysM peptidoglycan-binding domain-containing protein, partial [Pseudoxanthomonas sp.]
MATGRNAHPLRWAMLVATVFALGACGTATVTRTSAPGGQSGPSAAVVSKPQYGKTVLVQRGQTLYRIASDNGVAVTDLAAWNSLAPPYTIYPGQSLRLFPQGGRPAAVASTPARPSTGVAATPATSTAPPPVRSPFALRDQAQALPGIDGVGRR